MGAIKSPALFVISLLIGLIAVGFVIDRLVFLAHAQHTLGTVKYLHAFNGSRSCGRHCHYACTRFNADVNFPESQIDEPLVVSAGTAHGYDQPLASAQYRTGDSVPVVYDPRNTRRAYRDSFEDVWGAPVAAPFFFHIFALIGSFSQHRRNFSSLGLSSS